MCFSHEGMDRFHVFSSSQNYTQSSSPETILENFEKSHEPFTLLEVCI